MASPMDAAGPQRHQPSIMLAMIVLLIVLTVTSTSKKELPSPRSVAAVAFVGFILLLLSQSAALYACSSRLSAAQTLQDALGPSLADLCSQAL